MKRKIALKRLSHSDLTLFEYHYRNTRGAKQKAINLDSSVFIASMYPGIPLRTGEASDRVIVMISLYGPAGSGAHGITRKILKQQKNWRLNGELISNPPEEPGRYDSLEKGDYAIIEFIGESAPHSARMYLVARAAREDVELHSALDEEYGPAFSARSGMIELESDGLARLLGEVELSDGHPVMDFLDSDALEDAALGGLEGRLSLGRRRRGRGVSRDELARARVGADRVGRLGEELLNEWLGAEFSGKDESHRWDSDDNAVAPFDFSVLVNGEVRRRIDAKSTTGPFSNPIHVSLAELHEMAYGDVPYDLYRLYLVTDSRALVRVARDTRAFAGGLLEKFNQLPKGVSVDGVSVQPDVLDFGNEQVMDFSMDDEF